MSHLARHIKRGVPKRLLQLSAQHRRHHRRRLWTTASGFETLLPWIMSTLADVFLELNELKATGLLRDYALGGATAALFYAEPARTYDIDVFVLLPPPAHPLAAVARVASSR